MYKKLIENLNINFNKTLEYLKGELGSLQVGRATPSLIENLKVDCYGQELSINQLAAISAPEPRLIIIKPWDKEIIKNIESAIRDSKLGLNPITEEEFIRVSIPALNEERRKELVKIVQEKTEECRISIRRSRGDVWDQIQAMEQAKEISEDEKFKAKDELQKVIDEYNKKIEDISKKKEEDIMTI